MIREALDDAGLTDRRRRRVFSNRPGWAPSMELRRVPRHPARASPTRPTTGGSSFEIHVEHAAAAIALGLCDVAVDRVRRHAPRSIASAGSGGVPQPADAGGANPSARVGAALRLAHADGRLRPGGQPAHGRVRHDVGAARPDRGRAPAQWATMNPRARYQDPITSTTCSPRRCEASPLHKLDCCLVTDGAGAVVMTVGRAGARPARSRRCYVLGAGTCHTHAMISQMPDLTVTARRGVRPGGVRAGRHQAGRRRCRAALRLVHDHRAVAARGPRVLRRRARAARSWPTACSDRAARCPANTNGGGLAAGRGIVGGAEQRADRNPLVLR